MAGKMTHQHQVVLEHQLADFGIFSWKKLLKVFLDFFESNFGSKEFS